MNGNRRYGEHRIAIAFAIAGMFIREGAGASPESEDFAAKNLSDLPAIDVIHRE